MRGRFILFALWALMAVELPMTAFALTIELEITPDSVKLGDCPFSIKAEKLEGRLIGFHITYILPTTELHLPTNIAFKDGDFGLMKNITPLLPTTQQYLAANIEIKDGEVTLMKSSTPSFVHDKSASYWIAVPEKYIANSKFELIVRGFDYIAQKPVAYVGGRNYQVNLAEFAKQAVPSSR